jgi:hypothetical protein
MKINIIKLTLIFIFIIYSSTGYTDYTEIYPLIVYGGEPEGIMAAIAAARQGTKTLLIMKRAEPGGLMTYGGLNYLDLNYGPDGRGLNQNRGLFAEWHNRVGRDIHFSIQEASQVFQEMLADEDKLTVYSNTELLGLRVQNNEIKEIIISQKEGKKRIGVQMLIDASQDAELAVMADVPCFTGGADIGLPETHMAVTLILHMDNIDWELLKRDVKSQKFGPSYIDKDHAWGFIKIGQLYKPQDKNIKLRGLNIVKETENKQSEVYINSMLIFDVDPLDPDSLLDAYQRGQREAEYILSFLREHLGGFAGAVLLEPPSELYIREGRHILAEYQLRVKDQFANRIFPDTVALASYPLDYQASTPEYEGFVLFNPVIYGIPLRSLIARDINNLMVVGRSSGYSSLAAASARVLPVGMTTGEAAGVTAATSLSKGLTLREVSENKEIMDYIQEKIGLKKRLDSFKHTSGLLIDDKILLPYLEELLSWGLVTGGYNNDFKLEEYITEREFAHIIVKGLKRRDAPILYEWVPGGMETMSNNQPLSRNQAAMLLLVAVSKRISELSPDDYYSQAVELDLIPEMIQQTVSSNRHLNKREAYIIISSFLKKYPPSDKLRFLRGDNNDSI